MKTERLWAYLICHFSIQTRYRTGGGETICPPPMAVRRWQKSRRIYVRSLHVSGGLGSCAMGQTDGRIALGRGIIKIKLITTTHYAANYLSLLKQIVHVWSTLLIETMIKWTIVGQLS